MDANEFHKEAMSTLLDQCRREAEEVFPSQPERLRELGYDDSAVWNACTEQAARRGAYAAALYHERSKRPPTVEGPPMITVDEAMAIAWPWIMQTHGGIAPPTGAEADLRERLTAAATNNTNDNG